MLKSHKPQEFWEIWHKLLLIHDLERERERGESVKYLSYRHTFETSLFL